LTAFADEDYAGPRVDYKAEYALRRAIGSIADGMTK